MLRKQVSKKEDIKNDCRKKKKQPTNDHFKSAKTVCLKSGIKDKTSLITNYYYYYCVKISC